MAVNCSLIITDWPVALLAILNSSAGNLCLISPKQWCLAIYACNPLKQTNVYAQELAYLLRQQYVKRNKVKQCSWICRKATT